MIRPEKNEGDDLYRMRAYGGKVVESVNTVQAGPCGVTAFVTVWGKQQWKHVLPT